MTAALLGVAALVACIGISLGFRELRHTYAAMQNALAAIKEKGDGSPPDDPDADEYRARLGSVTATVEEAMNEIDVSAAAADSSKA